MARAIMYACVPYECASGIKQFILKGRATYEKTSNQYSVGSHREEIRARRPDTVCVRGESLAPPIGGGKSESNPNDKIAKEFMGRIEGKVRKEKGMQSEGLLSRFGIPVQVVEGQMVELKSGADVRDNIALCPAYSDLFRVNYSFGLNRTLEFGMRNGPRKGAKGAKMNKESREPGRDRVEWLESSGDSRNPLSRIFADNSNGLRDDG